uniref:Uncharacterized protein n=1 Tax=Riboviria sp. TaxID=2585031 RepID=A0A514D8A4_9VIRU|nr:MAG: hypothetical protein H3RhizoLitter15390_000002 [Riboviria sp.]
MLKALLEGYTAIVLRRRLLLPEPAVEIVMWSAFVAEVMDIIRESARIKHKYRRHILDAVGPLSHLSQERVSLMLLLSLMLKKNVPSPQGEHDWLGVHQRVLERLYQVDLSRYPTLCMSLHVNLSQIQWGLQFPLEVMMRPRSSPVVFRALSEMGNPLFHKARPTWSQATIASKNLEEMMMLMAMTRGISNSPIESLLGSSAVSLSMDYFFSWHFFLSQFILIC